MKSEKEKLSELANWLHQEYGKWMVRNNRVGERAPSLTDFALEIGVKQPTFSKWYNGQVPPSREAIDLIALKLGPEIYGILEVSERLPADPDLRKIARKWHKLPKRFRAELIERMDNFLLEQEEGEKGKLQTSNQVA